MSSLLGSGRGRRRTRSGPTRACMRSTDRRTAHMAASLREDLREVKIWLRTTEVCWCCDSIWYWSRLARPSGLEWFNGNVVWYCPLCRKGKCGELHKTKVRISEDGMDCLECGYSAMPDYRGKKFIGYIHIGNGSVWCNAKELEEK